jgi:hypothetical protein
MGSAEYWQGRDLEKNQALHEECKNIFQFDQVEADGGTGTKGDIIGFRGEDRIHVSVKYASGANTQVHLSTLDSTSRSLNMPIEIKDRLDRFLGTNDLAQWNSWSQGIALNADELKYRRINSFHIDGWSEVEQWFNSNARSVAQLLLQSLNNEHPAPYMIWANKKKGGYQALDVNRLVDWIVAECRWITMPKGTVLRCVCPLEEGRKRQKPIFWLQMKNSGGPPDGYNHAPQFHLVSNWPKEFIIHENNSIKF